jgi:hypothetical protein
MATAPLVLILIRITIHFLDISVPEKANIAAIENSLRYSISHWFRDSENFKFREISIAEWANSGSLVTSDISVELYEDQIRDKSAYEAQLREIIGTGFMDQFQVDLQEFDFDILPGEPEDYPNVAERDENAVVSRQRRGYGRNGGYGGYGHGGHSCDRCPCKNRCNDCDQNCNCNQCTHHSTGSHCQYCEEGHYGSPSRGYPCQPCPCQHGHCSRWNVQPTCRCEPRWCGPICDQCCEPPCHIPPEVEPPCSDDPRRHCKPCTDYPCPQCTTPPPCTTPPTPVTPPPICDAHVAPQSLVLTSSSNTLHCYITNVHAKYIQSIYWTHNNGPLNDQIVFTQQLHSRLTLNPARYDHQGHYRCHAKSYYPDPLCHSYADVTIGPSTTSTTTTTTTPPPTPPHCKCIDIPQSDFTHAECNDQLELTCVCIDPPNYPINGYIQWTKIDKSGRESNINYLMRNDGSIFIRHLKPSDSGLYKCTFTDQQQRRQLYTSTQLVGVEVRPCNVSVDCICIECESFPAPKIGQFTNLRCNAGARPGVTYDYKWKKNGTPFGGSGANLPVTIRSEPGVDRYTCEANNGIQSLFADAVIEVK